MLARTFTLGLGQSAQDIQLGFLARSITVNNPTPAYWYLPGQQQYILPYVSNMVVRITSPTQVASIIYAAPDGIVQPTPVGQPTTAFATIVYDEADAPTQAGILAANSAYGRGVNFTRLLLGASTAFTLPVPSPDGILMLVDAPQSGSNAVRSIAVSAALPDAPNDIITLYNADIGVGPSYRLYSANYPRFRVAFPLPAFTRIRVSGSITADSNATILVLY